MEPDEPVLTPCKLLSSSKSGHETVQIPQDQLPTGVSNGYRESLQDADGEAGAPPVVGNCNEKMATEVRIGKLLKGKEKEWSAAVKKDGPLKLLDLPLDVLKDILNKVTHTNDLTSLALTHSALHSVVTPLIYSRFDIVWPDTQSNNDSRTGVDALTYGLATLVMREDLFENAMRASDAAGGGKCQRFACAHCGSSNYLSDVSQRPPEKRRLRRGNYFSQFTRKFSLGNGPSDWVQEYLVTKESGKMLGTLVALSIARMPNLEAFVWDMPTGILRDIWIALSSLGDYQPSRLEKLWVRLHDNRAALQEAGITQPNTVSPSSQAMPAPATAPPDQTPGTQLETDIGLTKVAWSNHHLEQPNFSIIPSLRSLTVLDIDEVGYLVELSVLLERSLDKLRELRIGIAPTLHTSGHVREGTFLKRLFRGGIIALLMSKIYDHLGALEVTDMQRKPVSDSAASSTGPQANANLAAPVATITSTNTDLGEVGGVLINASDITTQEAQESPFYPPGSLSSVSNHSAIDPSLLEPPSLKDTTIPEPGGESGSKANTAKDSATDFVARDDTMKERTSSSRAAIQRDSNDASNNSENILNPTRKLRVEGLEIEKVTLNVHVLQKSIDWSILTSLTLLKCGDHEVLWSSLKRTYAPRPKSLVLSIPTKSLKKHETHPRLRRMPSSDSLLKPSDYGLSLKRLHTDTVSQSLISFLKTTLAPNSLEWMFLQDTGLSLSHVTIDSIYRGPLRRHRGSLTKVMIDSAYGLSDNFRNSALRKWMLNREVLSFITSGKMNKLKELAITVEYKDWHFLLQRLPQIPHLRSLYVPHVVEHVYGNGLNVKEMAMGVIDVVTLRPEIELCYLAISAKCFEIMETKQHRKSPSPSSTASASSPAAETDDESEHDNHNNADPDDDDDDEAEASPTPQPADLEDEHSEAGERSATSDEENDDDSENGPGRAKNRVKLKLREILFYDDKISIFKARHGRL